MSGRTDWASRVIAASPEDLYAAFVDPQALIAWLPPKGMTGKMLAFEPRVGGAYRMALTYAEPDPAAPGKTSDDSDVVEGRFVELVPGKRIVQLAAFDSDDPAFAGTMRISWSFTPGAEGTEVLVRCDDVPQGIRKEDHLKGLRSSLANLAAFVESAA